jgi:hypothetical protein
VRFVISIVAALMILSLAAFGVASAQLKPSQSVGGLSTCQRRILRLRTRFCRHRKWLRTSAQALYISGLTH